MNSLQRYSKRKLRSSFQCKFIATFSFPFYRITINNITMKVSFKYRSSHRLFYYVYDVFFYYILMTSHIKSASYLNPSTLATELESRS